ncbi:MAG: IS21 family transposase [Peptococcaceae bacterium]|nr:IS21 family transposase [Peptococcaceae bacterium]
MAIELEMYEKIRYLYEHEGRTQRAIARMLSVSRNTVKKYCEGAQVPWERQGVSGRQRYIITEEVLTFIKDCFAKDKDENIRNQEHTAKRIYDRLAAERDFRGGASTIRKIVANLKEKQGLVFVPLSFDPGEAIQNDWGQAMVYLAGKKTKVNIFCMRECYSADMFCKAFYRPNEESFLEAQIDGFEFFQGVAQRMIFDNARVAVKEGFGPHAIVQDRYKALAAHYAFHCDFCNVSSGHEKGLVEGLVGWVRRNVFVPIPRVETIDELNAEILRRCLQYRKHRIAGRNQTVGEMILAAQVKMASLPRYRFDPSRTITAKADDYATVRFDSNNYSIPAKYAGKEVGVKGYGNAVIIFYRNEELARYARCYEKGQTQYRLEHYLDLIESRPRSVFNARPVKDNISARLLEMGRRLLGPREMVKMLRLCVDHGEDKVMDIINSIDKPA